MSIPHLNPVKFDKVVSGLRSFFRNRGWREAYTQNRLSIMAACEDPGTISTYQYAGKKWPLIQTNQMWLEHLLLEEEKQAAVSPSTAMRSEGFYCLSTSYRNEPNPIPGRHDLAFPLFEFESRGDIDELVKVEEELLEHLGFKGPFPKGKYADICARFGSEEVGDVEEAQLAKEDGPVFFLTDFTEESNPYWNMKRAEDGTSCKVDVILHGVETIGSAERSCDPEDMKKRFLSISDGEYAGLLYEKFGKQRVEDELDEFFDLPFIPRYGGGIGVTRLMKAMELEGLI